jgi:uncharacterized damage-inducible protein DinB
MDAESLLAFVRYHAWANDRLLTTTAGLSDEEFRRAAVLDHGSAFDTLRHLVDVDWSWREYCLGNDIGDTYHGTTGSRSTISRLSTRSASRKTGVCGATWDPSTKRG